MSHIGSRTLRDFDQADDDEQNREAAAKANDSHLFEQEEQSNCNQHSRTHQPMRSAPRTAAAAIANVVIAISVIRHG